MNKFKKVFIAGLIVILPILFTVLLLIAILDFLDGILGNFVNRIMIKFFGFYIPGVGLISFLILTFVVGFFARKYIGKAFLSLFEKFFLKFPLIKLIYPAAKQIIQFLFSAEEVPFKKVVLVEYPRRGIYVIGFFTNEGLKDACTKTGLDLVNVFIPSPPNPLSGFYIMMERKEVITLEISVEDALKLIVSGGVVNPIDGQK